MEPDFDPYYKWLGISRAEQPPNHYRLLGVPVFENDPVVIESAADQRMAHLRSFQTGKNGALSQRLLNEVSAATICLLNANKKSAYDLKLRTELNTRTVSSAGMHPSPHTTTVPVASILPLSMTPNPLTPSPVNPMQPVAAPSSNYVRASEPKYSQTIERTFEPRASGPIGGHRRYAKAKKSNAMPLAIIVSGTALAIGILLVLMNSGENTPNQPVATKPGEKGKEQSKRSTISETTIKNDNSSTAIPAANTSNDESANSVHPPIVPGLLQNEVVPQPKIEEEFKYENGRVYLDKMRATDISGIFAVGNLGYTLLKDNKIVMHGVTYERGLSLRPPTHGSSSVSYDLSGKFKTLNGAFGMASHNMVALLVDCEFKIMGDGNELKSLVVRKGSREQLQIPVTGVKKLTITTICKDRNDRAYTVIGDPYLE